MDKTAFVPRRDGDQALLFLPGAAGDGVEPVRSLYWFEVEPRDDGWVARVPVERVTTWLDMAVAADFPGGDRRAWRLATRYAQVRLRMDPLALGVSPPVLGAVAFQRREA